MSKADLQRQTAILEEEIEELKKTTNKDQISDFYSALEAEILRISKETVKDSLGLEQKNVSVLDLLKDIEKKIENQLLALRICN